MDQLSPSSPCLASKGDDILENSASKNKNSLPIIAHEEAGLIEETFTIIFKKKLEELSCKDAEKSNLLKKSVYKFVRSKIEKDADKRIEFSLRKNFLISLIAKDDIQSKKHEEEDVGFFNFILYFYQRNSSSDRRLIVSKLDEINIEPKFQRCGLFKVIFETYTRTLKSLGAQMDFLHVQSDEPFTASLYRNNGYVFTPRSKDVIREKFGGIKAYLENSSVSRLSSDIIRMDRYLDDANLTLAEKFSSLDSWKKIAIETIVMTLDPEHSLLEDALLGQVDQKNRLASNSLLFELINTIVKEGN